MIERISILDEIARGGYEASIVTSFNAHLPLYEDVVLRRLMNKGVRHNILMMDAAQAALAIDRHPPHLAGRHYTFIPISTNGAFHPKIIFLVGKNKGILLIGSHNLTLSGFGYNREMTNLIRCKGTSDSETVNLFVSVLQSVRDWATNQEPSLPQHIVSMIDKVTSFAPWLNVDETNESETGKVISSRHDRVSLWDQMIEFTGKGPIEKVIVNGAFFDSELSFIKKIQRDLQPTKLFVGIDPTSAQLPANIMVPGVQFINCSELGPSETSEKQTGYLHAKSILLETRDNECLLAVGSANPSYPAWLAPGNTKNIEIMMVRKGRDAHETAQELGLLNIPEMPAITEQEWLTIKQRWELEKSSIDAKSAPRIITAIATDHQIRFTLPGDSQPEQIDCHFQTSVGNPLTFHANCVGNEYFFQYEGQNPPGTFFNFTADENEYIGIIQDTLHIDGLSRTKPQQRLDEALNSLITDMPDITGFIECIREIIESVDKLPDSSIEPVPIAQLQSEKMTPISKEGGDLSVSLVEAVKPNQQKKQRLVVNDNLRHLLDLILYDRAAYDGSLGLDTALEERDALGRSEEEQIDADDDEHDISQMYASTDVTARPRTCGSSILDICHSSVASLVSTMCRRLNNLVNGTSSLNSLIIDVIAVLSALRHLKSQDGKVPWIGEGQTAVPEMEFLRLFNKISEVLFDNEYSIVCLSSKHLSLKETDEFARLKGLIIWLAWEAKVVFTNKTFGETQERRMHRMRLNRLYVATAQLIDDDTDVIAEAQQSIGRFASVDMNWMNELLTTAKLIRNARSDTNKLHYGSNAKPENFGLDVSKPGSEAREILSIDGYYCYLTCHNSDKRRYKIPKANIRIVPF